MRDLSVLFVFLLLSACGASAAPVAEGDAQVGNLDASGDDRPLASMGPLCDGSAGIVLALRVVDPAGRVSAGAQVLWDNGAGFLYVTGDCRYWVYDINRGGTWHPFRTGTLSPVQAATLYNSLGIAGWNRIVGRWVGSVFDGSTLLFTRGPLTIACERNCDAPGTPPEVQALARQLPGVLTELARDAEPVTGPMRYVVVRPENPSLRDVFVLSPLALRLNEVAISDAEAARLQYGQGRLLDNPTDVSALRALRNLEGVRTDRTPYGYLAVTEDGVRYKIYPRDTLPFEDEQGLVILPR